MTSTTSDLFDLISINPSFTSPEIETMYEDLKKDVQFAKVLDFITFLIKFSPYYIIDLHNKNFELKLLVLLEESKNADYKPLIGQIVMLIGEFSQYISSEDVLKASLGLLQLSEDEFVANLHSSIVLSVNDTINICASRPRAYFSLTPDAPTLEISINPKSLIQNHFNISQWIYIPDEIPDNFKTHLFTILLEDKGVIKFTINKNDICYEVSKSSTINKLPNARIQSGVWTYIMIDFERNQTNYMISAILKGKQTKQVPVELDVLSSGVTKIHFAGAHDLTPNWPMLGPVCINSPVNNEYPACIYNFGPRFDISDSNAYQVVPSFNLQNLVSVSASSNDKVSLQIIGKKQKQSRCYLDILIEYCGVQTLLPLFSMIDKFCAVEEEIQSFMITMIEMIMKILQTSKLAQDQFVKVSGFSVIAQFLINQRHQNLTYGFYKKCYDLYCAIDDKTFKQQLLDTFILNFALWAHATNEQLKLVTRHWARIVYEDNFEDAIKVKPFETILSAMRTYFWYTEEKGEYTEYGAKSDNPRDPEVAINVIRSNLTNLLYNIAIKDFKEQYLTCLIGHCVTIPNSQQVNDLIVLVKLLALNEEQPYQKVTEHLSIFLLLHHLLNNANSALVFNCLEVFAALHVTESIKDIKENIHSTILMDFIPQNFFNYDNFSMIVPLVLKYPDFVSLMFYMISKIEDKQCIELVMDHLTPDYKYGKKKEWCIWPIITALTKRGEYGDFIMKFIAESTETEWVFSFSAIEVVGRALNVSFEEYQGLYMKYLTKRILDSPLMFFQDQHKFWDLATFFMFFRPEDSEFGITKNILRNFEVKKSKHASDVSHNQKIDLSLFLKINKTQLNSTFSEMNSDNYKMKYRYGLRFSKDGKWLDTELGLLLCKQACRTKCETFHNTSCIFAAFSLAEKPQESYEAISTLINIKVAQESYLNLIQHRDKRYFGKQVHTDCIEQLLTQIQEYNDELMKNSKVVTAKLVRFNERVVEKMDMIFQMSDTETNSSNFKDKLNYSSHIAKVKETFQKKANRLLKLSTSKGAPWESMSDKSDADKFLYITRTNGTNYIPMEAIMIKDLVKDGDLPIKIVPPTEDTERCDISEPITDAMEQFMKEKTEEYQNKTNLVIPKFERPDINQNFALPGKIYHVSDLQQDIVFSVLNESFEIRFCYNNLVLTFDSSNTKKVMFREIDGLPCGLEVYTTLGQSYLVILEDFNSLTVLNSIAQLKGFENIEVMTKQPFEYVVTSKITEKWLNYEITSLEYLLALNDIAGRSFNKLSLYPVMPNVNSNVTQHYNVRSVLDLLGTVEPYKTLLRNLGKGKLDKNLVSDISTIKTFYPPEYFASPYCLSSDVKLPTENIFEFIRSNIEKLESDDNMVIAFIDKVFGIGSSYKRMEDFDEGFVKDPFRRVNYEVELNFIRTQPIKLFYKEHPKRKQFEVKHPAAMDCQFKDLKSIKIIPEQKAQGCMASYVVFEPNTPIYRLSVNLNQEGSTSLFKKETNTKVEVGHIQRNCISDVSKGKIAIGNKSGELFMVYGQDGFDVCGSYFSSPIKKLVAGTEQMASVHDTNTINVWSARNPYQHLYLLPSFRGRVYDLAVDSDSSLLVVAYQDKSIAIFSLSLGEMIHEIELDFVAQHICICGNSSLIYVSNGKKLIAFTSNGIKVCEREFTSYITWIGGTKNKVSILTEANELYILDYINLKGKGREVLCSPKAKVVEIEFSGMPNVTSFYTETGQIVVASFKL